MFQIDSFLLVNWTKYVTNSFLESPLPIPQSALGVGVRRGQAKQKREPVNKIA